MGPLLKMPACSQPVDCLCYWTAGNQRPGGLIPDNLFMSPVVIFESINANFCNNILVSWLGMLHITTIFKGAIHGLDLLFIY